MEEGRSLSIPAAEAVRSVILIIYFTAWEERLDTEEKTQSQQINQVRADAHTAREGQAESFPSNVTQ